jgi:hypothetical protein
MIFVLMFVSNFVQKSTLEVSDFETEIACLACSILSRTHMDIDVGMLTDLSCRPSPTLELLAQEYVMRIGDSPISMVKFRSFVKTRKISLTVPVNPSYEISILSPIVNACIPGMGFRRLANPFMVEERFSCVSFLSVEPMHLHNKECQHALKTRGDISAWASPLLLQPETCALNWAMLTLLMRPHESQMVRVIPPLFHSTIVHMHNHTDSYTQHMTSYARHACFLLLP